MKDKKLHTTGKQEGITVIITVHGRSPKSPGGGYEVQVDKETTVIDKLPDKRHQREEDVWADWNRYGNKESFRQREAVLSGGAS